jgi:hypothetical protein
MAFLLTTRTGPGYNRVSPGKLERDAERTWIDLLLTVVQCRSRGNQATGGDKPDLRAAEGSRAAGWYRAGESLLSRTSVRRSATSFKRPYRHHSQIVSNWETIQSPSSDVRITSG